MNLNSTIRPEWLAARYHLPLPLARSLIRDRVGHHAKRLGWMALITVALVLVQIMAAYRAITLSKSLRLLLWPASLLVIVLHLYLAQRAARPEILLEAAQLGDHPANHPKD
ncbi:MAG: hypothetical protein B7X33_02465 [Lysobacterales bacterium 13-68-4]|nr:MAG: hypothetical protein B7X45_08655 [Xanthomonadales bacterium 15-68-25]OZB66497.1 MAG: hypothetical protein B7X39_10285 [Xanthomonadales bacterium 14-68-21]OZB70945.1 MAG: hypothetical protein B7X33_02465 [Xanthomonadales bacterium 13-68-4]